MLSERRPSPLSHRRMRLDTPMKGRLPIIIDGTMAMQDPTAVFEDPKDVVANVELTRDQKIEILRRWEYDARQLEVAEEEAGMAVRRPDMFDRVVQALHALDVERDIEHTPPTK